MSYDDFCRCTPSEFALVAENWKSHEEVLNQRSWVQTRYMMVSMLQPYCKKPIKATDILLFEWDKQKTPPKSTEKSTRERMEEIEARLKKLRNE